MGWKVEGMERGRGRKGEMIGSCKRPPREEGNGGVNALPSY